MVQISAGENMRDKIQMIVFVLVLGALLTSALVSVDAFTKPFIEANMAKKLQTSVLSAAGIEFDEKNPSEAFSKNIKEIAYENGKEGMFYVTGSDEVIFEFTGSGLQDQVFGAICMNPDLETIKGITIVKQNETPGLGGRIKDAEFLNQFKGKKFFPEIKIQSPGKASGDNEVDGISGATLSCNALEVMLNSESKKYIPAIKESMKQ
jgi:Na+-transporting NADH:ubiquinone oxidoreductase subunit C